MKTNEELRKEIEEEINPTGKIGLSVGVLIARLEYAEEMAENTLRSLKSVYESTGNDCWVSIVDRCLKNLNGVMGRE